MQNATHVTEVKVKDAFGTVVPGFDKAPDAATLVGFNGMDQHPFQVQVMEDADFLFDKEAWMTMAYAWNREWSRKDTDPRRGVWFGGPKGTGKTTLVEQFFGRLKVPVTVITCNRKTPLADLLTKMSPDGTGGWIQTPGPLKLAMQMGLPVCLNEVSRMDPADLVAVNDIIDRGIHVMDDGEVVRAARGFVVFATDNTMGFGDERGAYMDANMMDQSFLSRFLKFEVTYPAEEVEIKILQNRAGLDEATARQHVKFATAVRHAYERATSSVTMGTRELIDWAQASTYFGSLKTEAGALFALRRVMGGCPGQEMKALEQIYRSTFGG